MGGLADLAEPREGYLWPKGDVQAFPTIKGELAEIPDLVALCPQRRVCVQAGGNGGLWVEQLAELFDAVYTFEPDALNFRCLVHNVAQDNVVFFNAALGEKFAGFVSVDRWCGNQNIGAHRTKSGGRIPVVAIDSLDLPVLDLLQLDIEGAELSALRGAELTINRARPVICLELRNHSGHYGTSDEQIRDWLRGWGYRLERRMNFDEFWIPA